MTHRIDRISEDQVFQTAVAVGAHDEQIRMDFAGVAHDFPAGREEWRTAVSTSRCS